MGRFYEVRKGTDCSKRKMAERAGFEPAVRKNRTTAFEAAAFNHSGLYVTETKTLFGAYDPCGVPTCHSNPGVADGYFTHNLLIARSGPVSGQTTTATRAAT